MKSALIWTRIYLFTFYISFRAAFRMNLGNKVMYGGKKFTVSNGVCAPKCWSLVRGYPTFKDGQIIPADVPHEYVEYADMSEIKWRLTPYNFKRSFIGRWHWAKDCWWQIWHDEGMRK